MFSFIRRVGTHEMKISRDIFSKTSVLPVIDYFYQPLIKLNSILLKKYYHGKHKRITSKSNHF